MTFIFYKHEVIHFNSNTSFGFRKIKVFIVSSAVLRGCFSASAIYKTQLFHFWILLWSCANGYVSLLFKIIWQLGKQWVKIKKHCIGIFVCYSKIIQWVESVIEQWKYTTYLNQVTMVIGKLSYSVKNRKSNNITSAFCLFWTWEFWCFYSCLFCLQKPITPQVCRI